MLQLDRGDSMDIKEKLEELGRKQQVNTALGRIELAESFPVQPPATKPPVLRDWFISLRDQCIVANKAA